MYDTLNWTSSVILNLFICMAYWFERLALCGIYNWMSSVAWPLELNVYLCMVSSLEHLAFHGILHWTGCFIWYFEINVYRCMKDWIKQWTCSVLWHQESRIERLPFKNIFNQTSSFVHTEKSFRNLVKSNRNQIVFIIFQLIWNQTNVRLVQNQSSEMVNTIWFRFDLT